MREIKQGTIITVRFGPFLDDVDGKTAEIGLSLVQSDIRLSKNGGDFAQKTDATAITHDENGYYIVTLENTVDTATLGDLKMACHVAGALPVIAEFAVVTANYWDSKYGTERFDVNVMEVQGETPITTDDIKTKAAEAIADAGVATSTDTNLIKADTAATKIHAESIETKVDTLATEASATENKEDIIDEVNANEVKIDAIGTIVSSMINSIFAKTGITEGGTSSFAKIQNVLIAMLAGNVQKKEGVTGTYEILDIDDGVTVIAEVTPDTEVGRIVTIL